MNYIPQTIVPAVNVASIMHNPRGKTPRNNRVYIRYMFIGINICNMYRFIASTD